MNKYLEELVKLSKFDTRINAYEPEIENEKNKLAVFVDVADEIKNSIDVSCVEIDDAKLKRTKNNSHLEELKNKLIDIAKKNSLVKSEKELKALQLEEEIAKEQITFANEEINRLDNIILSKNDLIKELKEKLEKEELSIKDIQVSVNSAIEALHESRNEVYQSRGLLLEKFDAKILTFYEKIRRWAKDSAVVPVRKQACYGCFMKISDKSYSEVIKSDEIINCPHCGRILYKEKEESQEA